MMENRVFVTLNTAQAIMSEFSVTTAYLYMCTIKMLKAQKWCGQRPVQQRRIKLKR